MSEVTRGEILEIVGGFAASNPDYRKKLLSNPKEVLEKQMNTKLPESVKVKVVEETADTIYLIAPYVPKKGDELSDADLEKVAGGKGGGKGGGQGGGRTENQNRYTCNDIRGVGTRVEITGNVG